MKVISLRFPGRFEDAFLYMGRLVTITENHSIRVYDMDYIVKKIEEDKTLCDVPTLLFFRNDWLEDKIGSHRTINARDKATFLKAVEQLELASIEIDEHFVQPVEWDLNITADILLDLNIYNGRAYIGTNAGLYHLDLDWDADEIAPIGTAQKRIDAKCIHTTAKFGTVNASCGYDGWFSFLDDFGLGDNGTQKTKHIEECSLRTAWLEFNVVNYPTTVSPNLFSSLRMSLIPDITESKNNFEHEQWIVTELKEEKTPLKSLLKTSGKYKFDTENLQFVYNSSQALFVSTYNGNLYALGLEIGDQSAPRVKYIREYEGLKGSVSSIHTINAGNNPGLIIETDQEVILFAHQEFRQVFDKEVISIRTFSRSRYHRSIVSITTANEVVLIALFDEEAYSKLKLSR